MSVILTVVKSVPVFSARLGAKNGIASHVYDFKLLHLQTPAAKGQTYSQLMVAACKTVGMKPVCDHPNYCRNNPNSM